MKFVKSSSNHLFLAIGIIFFILLISACKKSGEVSGSVINVMTGEPLEGVPMSVLVLNSGMFSKNGTETIAHTITDANGKFILSFRTNSKKTNGRNVEAYFQTKLEIDTVSDIKELYTREVDYPGMIYGKTIGIKGEDNIELKIAPAARVKVLCTNVNPVNSADKIEIITYDNNYTHSLYSMFGLAVPLVKYFQLPSNGKIFIKWIVEKNSITNTYYDTLNVKPFEKAVYHINY
jgi:hypothetical protein